MTVKILNKTQKDIIVKGFMEGIPKAQLARQYNVSSDTITRVIKEQQRPIPDVQSEKEPKVIVVLGKTIGEVIDEITAFIDSRTQFKLDFTKVEDKFIYDLLDELLEEYDVAPIGTIYESVFFNVLQSVENYYDEDTTLEQINSEIFGVAEGFSLCDVVTQKIAEPEVKQAKEVKAVEPIWNASSKFISITIGRDVYNADKDHVNFAKALKLLAENDIYGALDLINVEKAITRFVDGDVRIENGMLFFKDIELNTGLTNRIVELMEKGEDFKFLLPFLNNLMLNPSRKAVYRLFDFLEANDIEITKDGYFIAWKKVAGDYKDIYTRTLDNSPGKTLQVPRNQVDEDDHRTCSHGLHVCSKSYLSYYGSCSGNRIVSVKVHPKDVVSIPVDYNNAKMRTTGYTVLEDVTSKF